MSPRDDATSITERSTLLGAAARFCVRSYAPDYIGLAALLTGYILMISFVEPFHELFSINDLRISYPHALVERVSVPMNFIYALFTPLLILSAYLFLTNAPLHKHHITHLSFLTSIILTVFLTDILKNAVGRPRPDLLARCKPSPDTLPNTLVTITVCTQIDSHVLQDGWRSFPSGHSSFSFAGLGYLSLFLSGQLGIFRHGGGDLGRSLLCLTPLLGALMIAISRCEDYRHDVYDVTVGSALGFSVAYWSYRRFWPRLRSRDSDEPLPPPGTELEGYGRVDDEEEGRIRGNGAFEMASLSR